MALDLITARKRSQGYLAPSERDGCRNCAHGHRSPSNFSSRTFIDCAKGRFIASPSGICPHHQPAGVAGLPKKESAP